MEPRSNPQITRVHERPEIDRLGGLVGLEQRGDGTKDGVFLQLSQQQTCALAQPARVAIGTKQQHRVGVLGIGDRPHATECARSVVQGMGGNGDPGLLKRNALALKPGIGQELLHC